ncbi:MAG: S8 family peptidase [bacterium]
MMRLKLALIVLTVGVFIALFVLNASESESQKEVLIKFRQQAHISQIDSLTMALGLTKVKSFKEINVDVFKISSEYSVNEVVSICTNLPFIEYAEPTAAVRAFSIETETSETSSEVIAKAQAQKQAKVAQFKPAEVLIKFKDTVATASINQILSNVGLSIHKSYEEIGVIRCSINIEKTVLKTVEQCNADSRVVFAEPNYIYHTFVIPDDPRFSSLFGLDNIDAPEAWDIQTGSKSIIVGVIDTGADHGHEDLQANIWKNPGESGDSKENNNVDDDGNGLVDDFQGWDFINNDNNPFDDNDHGTHVSGTIGAVGNNSKGVVGVNWNVSIMPLKFLGADGSGTSADAIEAILYATNMGAKVLSNSWGGGGFSRALEDAIKFANQNGVIFVAAAGNESNNNDSFPTYPANYEIENVISVAASTKKDNLAGFSNWGKKTVDLAAPGADILSTFPRDRYGQLSGTSMATPHVSGAAALVWAQYPSLSMNQVKIRILGSVDIISKLANDVATGGRLNVNQALSTIPIIANTTRLENTLDQVGPYVVESDIIDDISIQTATLTYQVDTQQAVTVSMISTGNDHYRGEILGQSLGSKIEYFVTATDGDGNSTQDRKLSFSIAEPTNGGCGCGKPALEVNIKNPQLRTTVNAVANISFFVLPLLIYKIHTNRRKKRSQKIKKS